MVSSSSNTSGPSPLRLQCVIVGGGIAGDHLFSTRMGQDFLNIMFKGLATAFTLQRAGHSVIVLEKWNEKPMVCIGLLVVYSAYTHRAYRYLARRAVLSGEYP